MNNSNLDFLPLDGFNANWLKELYQKQVARSRAVGKDGIRLHAFEASLEKECDLIAARVNDGTYRFTSFREKLIARGASRNPRQISIPTIRDRLALRGALEFLKAEFPTAQPRPPHVYIKEVKAQVKVARQHSSFLRMDIRDFYPSLKHSLLDTILRQSSLPKPVANLIMLAVSTRTGSLNQPKPEMGVPQGLSIANALAAIYMADLDKLLEKDIFYKRYVDDILVIDRSENVKSTYLRLVESLGQVGLTSHPLETLGKTEIKKIGDGIQYLGYEISPSIVSIRRSSVAKMFSNLSKVITCFKYKKEHEKHLFRLNLKITGCVINNARRGWLMFFSQTEDVSQLAFLDSWLEKEIEKFSLDKKLIKKFKKSYYEIRFNLADSVYIPNFDKYDYQQKCDVILTLSKRTKDQVGLMDVLEIDREFSRLIGKEISELERDLVDAFS